MKQWWWYDDDDNVGDVVDDEHNNDDDCDSDDDDGNDSDDEEKVMWWLWWSDISMVLDIPVSGSDGLGSANLPQHVLPPNQPGNTLQFSTLSIQTDVHEHI